MEIGLVCRGGVENYASLAEELGEKERRKAFSVKVLAFGMQGLCEVAYERELCGETAYFEEVALLSREIGGVVICGCVTDTLGQKRKSAVVADKGKILGVSDATNAFDGENSAGASLRVYETSQGRIGVLVERDLYFPEAVKALATCGSEIIVCPFGEMTGSIENVLARGYAFCYGVPIIVCGLGYAFCAGMAGDTLFASSDSPFTFSLSLEREYHLIETRSKGFFKRSQGEY
ncbi:MAG: hypothetical protein IJV80_04360 [Clostridia bacterium]|nr:hypothetical protein [Clostridia bacterium]